MTVRRILVAICLLAGVAPAGAQAAGRDLWDTTARPTADRHAGHPVAVRATRLRALTLDQPGLEDLLPGRGDTQTVALPAPGGGFERFDVRPSQVMSPGLAARHPDIRTYEGRGVDDPLTTVHLDLGPNGFHAAVRGSGGTWYVDPYFRNDPSRYASYEGAALPRRSSFEEGVVVAPEPLGRLTDATLAGEPVTLRTYRLALLTDPTYAAFQGGAAKVVPAKVTLIDRVNQVYEDDLGIRLQLIDADLELNTAAEMTGANGPCGAQACFTTTQAGECGGETLDRTRIVLGQLAGADTFDIGHLALGTDGGGIASLGVVGGNLKAQGCTGIPQPIGDQYAVDYVAHEMGHQFSGNHTFNGTTANCGGGTRNASTSVEPGSGSSVMAYAGICGADDLQPHSDPYFSQRSLTEVNAYVGRAPAGVREVQDVALTGFDGADAFQLTSGGSTSATITRGSTYTATSIAAAVKAVTGATVTVKAFGNAATAVGDAGFEVQFPDTVDRPLLGVVPVAGSFTAHPGTTAQGGPSENGGHATAISANHAPVVVAPADAAIPLRTPFRLVGSGTDSDGDPLVYSWEQNDPGTGTGTPLFTQPKASGPLFRQFSTAADPPDPDTSPAAGENTPSAMPVRDFPDLAQVAANDTNAATGSCPAADVECFSEFLPTSGYGGLNPALHFRLTARDGQLPAGGVAFDDVTLNLVKSAGPFAITAPDTAQTLPAGGPVTVTWNVAGTTAAPIGAADVEIRLSTDGGLTFPNVLAASTPNDGSETVTLPVLSTGKARIQVASVPAGGAPERVVFFDVSGANLTIANSTTPVVSSSAPAAGASVVYTDPFVTPPSITAFDGDTAGSALTASAPALPAGLALTVTDTQAKQRTWTVTGTPDVAPGTSTVPVTVSDGNGHTGQTTLKVVVAPESATVAYTGETSAAAADDATSATVQLAARVTETPDPTPGDLGTATVTFKLGSSVLCSAPVAPVAGDPPAGTASCAASLPTGASNVQVLAGGRYAGSTSKSIVVSGGVQPGPSVTPTPTPEVTPTPTVPPEVTPTPTPSPTPPPEPEPDALLRPDLRGVAKRLTVSRKGVVTVKVGCGTASAGATPARCGGVVVLSAKLGGKRRTLATEVFDVAATRTAKVRLRLSRRGRAALEDHPLVARLSVQVLNGDAPLRSARKRLTLRPA